MEIAAVPAAAIILTPPASNLWPSVVNSSKLRPAAAEAARPVFRNCWIFLLRLRWS